MEIWEDDNFYQGEFLKSEKNGIGLYRWPDGTLCLGEWKDNKLNGYGIYKFADGSEYKGEWNKSMFHGYGEYIFPKIKKYIGFFSKDKRSGFGIEIGKRKEKKDKTRLKGRGKKTQKTLQKNWKKFERKTLWCEEKAKTLLNPASSTLSEVLQPNRHRETPPLSKRRKRKARQSTGRKTRRSSFPYAIEGEKGRKAEKKAGKQKCCFPRIPNCNSKEGARGKKRPFTLLNEQQRRQHQQRKQHSSSSR